MKNYLYIFAGGVSQFTSHAKTPNIQIFMTDEKKNTPKHESCQRVLLRTKYEPRNLLKNGCLPSKGQTSCSIPTKGPWDFFMSCHDQHVRPILCWWPKLKNRHNDNNAIKIVTKPSHQIALFADIFFLVFVLRWNCCIMNVHR